MSIPRTALTLANEFGRDLRTLDRTRQKVETLLIQGQLAKRDVERVYEGIFLQSVAGFEVFLERLFLGLLVGGLCTGVSRVKPRMIVRSHKVARDFVLAGESYVKWLPYDQTETRARIFFMGGRPFTQLDGQDKNVLKQCQIIRNAIAHRSQHAIRMYEDNIISGVPLPPRERQPAGYLRSQFRIAPPQCRYENLAAQMFRIAGKLCR